MKKQIIRWALLFVAAAIWSAPVSAQSPWYVGVGNGIGYGGNGYYGNGLVYGVGIGNGLSYGIGLGNYSGAQTAYSADAIGMANLVRAQGAYNQDTAKAMLSYERARSEYMENQQRAISARMANKRMAQADDAKQREEEHATQTRVAEFTATHKPSPLSQSQLDPTTGKIQWPVILTSKDFDEFRQSLDSMFETRSKSGQTAVLSTQISKKAGEMKDALRKQILTLPLPEYSEARRFLDSMAVTVH